jgi:hypothetical protein
LAGREIRRLKFGVQVDDSSMKRSSDL